MLTILTKSGALHRMIDLQSLIQVCLLLCRVSPVYRHVFPVATAPTLSIIGIPWKVVPFPEFEVQAKWIARVLSGRARLPSQAVMEAEVQQFHQDLEQQGIPIR